MKHIKNFGAVKKAIIAYFERETEAAKKTLEAMEGTFGNPKCFDKERNCYRLKNDVRWMAKGTVILQEDIEKARNNLEKTIPSERDMWMRRLEEADKAGKMVEINIRVEWSRSRMYGSNPRAVAYLCYEDEKYGTNSGMGEGSASGCGYDKRSAAVYEALCFNHKKRDGYGRLVTSLAARASLDRFVIEHGEALWKEYAVERTPMPHFHFDGKGMSVFTRLFRRIGCRYDPVPPVKDYLIDYTETDRGADVYHVIRKDRV